jgi:hypothetical protein
MTFPTPSPIATEAIGVLLVQSHFWGSNTCFTASLVCSWGKLQKFSVSLPGRQERYVHVPQWVPGESETLIRIKGPTWGLAWSWGAMTILVPLLGGGTEWEAEFPYDGVGDVTYW